MTAAPGNWGAAAVEDADKLRAQVDDLRGTLEAVKDAGRAYRHRAEAAETRIAVLTPALHIARLHAPLIRLAPERRYVIAALDAVLGEEPT